MSTSALAQMQRMIVQHGECEAMRLAHQRKDGVRRDHLIEAGFHLGVKWDWWCTEQAPGRYAHEPF